MADDDAGALAGKMFCPECGTQLDPDPSDPNVGSCNGCGFHGDPNTHIAAPDEAGEYDDDDLDADAPGTVEYQSGPTYADYVRGARGKSLEDLFAEASARVKPPKPIKTETELEEAVEEAAGAALIAQGTCPFCGADPDRIENGVCGECGATQPQGVTAWVVADPEGKALGTCSELCGKVGAARVGGKLLGKRPWTPPDDEEPLCFVCQEPLTEVATSASAPPAQPQQPPTVAPGPGGTTIVSGVSAAPNPFKDGDRVELPDGEKGNVSGVSPWSLGANDFSTGVDLDNGEHRVCSVDMLTRIEDA